MKATAYLEINRYEWASRTIKKVSCNKVHNTLFDVGARDSVLKASLDMNGISYHGYDLIPLKEEIREWNIEHPYPFQDEKPDIIVLLEVLEHLNNPWLSFKNLSTLLKAGGYLLLTTPNPAWSDSRLSLLRSGYLTCFTQDDLDCNHHVFTGWPHIVKKLLNDNQLEIIEFVTLDGRTELLAPPKKSLLNPLKLSYRLVKKLIESNSPEACGMSYGILAQKKP